MLLIDSGSHFSVTVCRAERGQDGFQVLCVTTKTLYRHGGEPRTLESAAPFSFPPLILFTPNPSVALSKPSAIPIQSSLSLTGTLSCPFHESPTLTNTPPCFPSYYAVPGNLTFCLSEAETGLELRILLPPLSFFFF